MLKVSKERILEKLNLYSREALKRASELCIERSGYEVTVSHYLLALLEQPASDVSKMLAQLKLSPERITALLRKSLESTKRGAVELPQFSPMLLELLQDAFMIVTAEFNEAEIRTGSIWIAAVQNPDRYCHFYLYTEFQNMDANAMLAGFRELTRGSMEGPVDEQGSGANGAVELEAESALQKYGRNITAEAREGKIDPVFCRENEISLMTDVLCRRRKNNPILVGEPGVGKTALAEGLALKIVEEDVPEPLKGADLWELDLGALQAGASVKGEFERRLKGVLDEVLNAASKIILFIDEAHTLVGGGGAAGGGDAANLLKPALARGQLRAIAATTWSEYKKYFEKDPALTRRFQLIKLDEPTPEQAVTILRGLRDVYEATHNVYISDAALNAASILSDRYITGRQLPDKALDVIDTACVRVAAGQSAKPKSLDILEKQIAMLKLEISDQSRDALMKAEGALENTDKAETELARLVLEADELSQRWENEKAVVEKVLELRAQIRENAMSDEDATNTEEGDVGDLESWQAEVLELLDKLKEDRKNEFPLVNFEVGAQAIADVISDWTGVPAAAMSDDDAEKIISLGDNLKSVVRGQDMAIDVIHDRIKAARLDFIRENTPRGVFLLVGPSGVGKTETGEQVALNLFGGKQFLTTINMSEYQEKHTVSRLIGSPPGYIGYGEGGVLTEAIRRKPYSVVLLDEVEKAHPDVMNIFYQAFDKGVINDGEGREIDCKNVVFFMTSNLGSEAIMQNQDSVQNASMEVMEKALRPHLEQHFKPALLARMRILCFKPLSDETIKMIINLKMASQADRFMKTRGLTLNWDDATLDQISDLCSHTENGARMVEQVIDRWLLPPIAEEALHRIARHTPMTTVNVSARDGGFELEFLPADSLEVDG